MFIYVYNKSSFHLYTNLFILLLPFQPFAFGVRLFSFLFFSFRFVFQAQLFIFIFYYLIWDMVGQDKKCVVLWKYTNYFSPFFSSLNIPYLVFLFLKIVIPFVVLRTNILLINTYYKLSTFYTLISNSAKDKMRTKT